MIDFSTTSLSATKMPVLFIGHGSPMNAIEKNLFTETLGQLGRSLPAPRAILVISAHWLTSGTRVESSEHPRTIHDFGAFPQALFEVQNPAPGQPKLAEALRNLWGPGLVSLDTTWGLDHGAWSVLLHMYPQAQIPVVQLSLDVNLNLKQHLALGEKLKALRNHGVLILGSGNITHNLRVLNWSQNAEPFPWAIEFDEMIKTALINRDLNEVLALKPEKQALWKMAHPTIDHYLPLLYTVGAGENNETPTFPYEKIEHGSLSMRAVRYG
jgi:4,5-DOPA dioxygenase extradiol